MEVINGVGPDAATVVDPKTGAKQSASPYRCDLLPARAVLEVAKVLEQGARKYGDNNWRPIPVHEHLNHLLMHLLAYEAGDSSDDHLAHAACRALMLLERSVLDRERTRRWMDELFSQRTWLVEMNRGEPEQGHADWPAYSGPGD